MMEKLKNVHVERKDVAISKRWPLFRRGKVLK
jgi:hypothetical protein